MLFMPRHLSYLLLELVILPKIVSSVLCVTSFVPSKSCIACSLSPPFVCAFINSCHVSPLFLASDNIVSKNPIRNLCIVLLCAISSFVYPTASGCLFSLVLIFSNIHCCKNWHC